MQLSANLGGEMETTMRIQTEILREILDSDGRRFGEVCTDDERGNCHGSQVQINKMLSYV